MIDDEGRRSAAGATREDRRAMLQLNRLETLSDVVFAIVIWRAFMILPNPLEAEVGWRTIGGFFAEEWPAFLAVGIGLAFTIIYWLQNNVLLGHLERTDGRHTLLVVLQLFFLLIFLRVIVMGVAFEPSAAMRALEGIAAAMVGISGAWGWAYAIKDRRLLPEELSDEEAGALNDRIAAEPATALFTIPFAFFPIFWEISWFSYPMWIRLVKRRRQGKAG
jgi:uncharacterized membrane protein